MTPSTGADVVDADEDDDDDDDAEPERERDAEDEEADPDPEARGALHSRFWSHHKFDIVYHGISVVH